MATPVKCPNCGLMQMRRPTCKACGAALEGMSPPRTATGPEPREAVGPAEVKWFQQNRIPLLAGGIGILLLVLLLIIFGPSGAPGRRGKLTEAERRVALEALQVLRGLQSITTAGVSYRDYAPRVLDAKVQLDRYLGMDSQKRRLMAWKTCQDEGFRQLSLKGAATWDKERRKQAIDEVIERCEELEKTGSSGTAGDKAVKFAIETAMDFYLLAGRAWNAKITGKVPMSEISEHILLDPLYQKCPSVTQPRDEARAAAGPRDKDFAAYDAVVERIPELWACASRLVDEAEETIRGYS